MKRKKWLGYKEPKTNGRVFQKIRLSERRSKCKRTSNKWSWTQMLKRSRFLRVARDK